jgi:hypothetical protein
MSSLQKCWCVIFLLVLTVGICLHVALVKKPLNYQVVTQAAENILNHKNPYSPQPGLDFFKYSPLAGLAAGPFAFLMDELGLFLFVFLQFWLFFWGFRRWTQAAGRPLDFRLAYFWIAISSVMFDTTVTLQNAQVNAGIFGLMLLGSAFYAEGKTIRAGLVLSLAANLKLFPFTLGLCLLTGFKKKYWAAFWGGLGLWFVLPAVFVGWRSNLELLKQWFRLMSWDQTRGLEMLDLGGFWELHLGWPAWWRNPLALLAGAVVGAGAYVLFRRGKSRLLHRYLLPINGLYILIFSYLSESPTSILAAAALYLIGAEALRVESKAWLYWVMWAGALALIPLFYSDLVPGGWNIWAESIHLKTVGYFWLAAACLHLFGKHHTQARKGNLLTD